MDAARAADAPQATPEAQGDVETVSCDSQGTHGHSPAVASACEAQADDREAPTLDDLREELAVATAERDEVSAALAVYQQAWVRARALCGLAARGIRRYSLLPAAAPDRQSPLADALETFPWSPEEEDMPDVPQEAQPAPADEVEALARAIWEMSGAAQPWSDDHGPQWEQDTRIDQDAYRAQARALLAAGWRRGGGREASASATVGAMIARWESRAHALAAHAETDYEHRDLLLAKAAEIGPFVDELLALPPTAAAEAVRDLVGDGDHALSVLLAVKAKTPDGPLLVMVDDAIAALRDSLRPFVGDGDADA